MREPCAETSATHVRATHGYGFRTGQWARILTVVQSRGRDCWLVQFDDGVTDWWPIEDPIAGYELVVNGPRPISEGMETS
jgi:hypothetical protein